MINKFDLIRPVTHSNRNDFSSVIVIPIEFVQFFYLIQLSFFGEAKKKRNHSHFLPEFISDRPEQAFFLFELILHNNIFFIFLLKKNEILNLNMFRSLIHCVLLLWRFQKCMLAMLKISTKTGKFQNTLGVLQLTCELTIRRTINYFIKIILIFYGISSKQNPV